MKLYHTSPRDIEKIHDQGLYGSSLFFSHNPYFMGGHEGIVYEMDIDENEILDVSRIPYLDLEDFEKIKPVVEEIQEITELNEEESTDLLSEKKDIQSLYNELEEYANFYHENDHNEDDKQRKLNLYENLGQKDLGDIAWKIQSLAGKAAKLLGFRGAKLFDEQGVSYLIDMMNKEYDLKKIL